MNKKLYVDGIRQLKIPGIIGTVLMSVIAFFVAYSGTFLLEPSSGAAVEVDFAQYMPLFMISSLVFTIILAIVMFSFLRHRNSSDFYHALPIKRESLYLTYAAAVLSWALAIVIIPMLIMISMYAMDLKHNLVPGRVLYVLLTVVVCTLLICGASLVGVSATGTGFTNFVVLAIVLIVPRAIMTAVVAVITSSVETVGFGDVPGFFSIRLNALFAVPYAYIDGLEYDGTYGLPSVTSLVYSTVLALIYGAWGLLAFKKRNSEVAGLPNFNRFWQGVTRTVPAFCLTAIGTMVLASYYLNGEMPDESDWFWILFTYAVAIVVYFLYELITTKKWKALGGAAKTLPILILANVLLYLATAIPTNALRNDFMDATHVSAVRIQNDNFGDYSTDLAWMDAGFVEDRELVNTLVNAHNDTLTVFYHQAQDSQKNPWEVKLDDGFQLYNHLTVAFKINGHTERRTIYVSAEQYNSMKQKLSEMAKNGEVELKLPEFSTRIWHVGLIDSIIDAFDYNEVQLRNLYNVWKDEVATYEAYSKLKNKEPVAKVSFFGGDATFSAPITLETPNALRTYITMANESIYANEWIKWMGENRAQTDYMRISVYDGEHMMSFHDEDGMYDGQEEALIREMVGDFIKYENLDKELSYVLGIEWNGKNANGQEYFNGSRILCFTADEYQTFYDKYLAHMITIDYEY